MQATFEDIRIARARHVQKIVEQLRPCGEVVAPIFLQTMIPPASRDAVLHKLLSPQSTRSHLVRVAFPLPGADREAIDAGLAAGNTIKSLWYLASLGRFEFEGRSYPAQALRDSRGQLQRAKNNTIKILYTDDRLTPSDCRYLRSTQRA